MGSLFDTGCFAQWGLIMKTMQEFLLVKEVVSMWDKLDEQQRAELLKEIDPLQGRNLMLHQLLPCLALLPRRRRR